MRSFTSSSMGSLAGSFPGSFAGSFTRKVAVAGALALAASGVTVATAGTASASSWGCSGTEVASYPLVRPDTGTTYSYVHLFWDSSTGYNCAVNVKVGSLYGVQTSTSVELDECAQDAPGNCTVVGNPAVDNGAYSYYAGPVRVYGQGHCIQLKADTWDQDDNLAGYNSLGGYHC
ncbi:hypothetical protein [Kitasatospora acidiphila]|uniref:hypothetical protein n=1 Tax=Kitasatospora acidiphila TaxID=2567942 RepID=UPI003C774D53